MTSSGPGVQFGGLAQFSAQLGQLHAAVSKINQAIEADRARRAQMQRAIHALPLPSVQFPVTAGSLTVPTGAILLGPEDGQVWDVRAISLAGWATADAAVIVQLFREQNVSQAAVQGNPQNRLAKFNDSAAGSERWSPSGGLILHSPDQLLITGTGFTTTAAITLNLAGIAFAQWLEPDYLL